MSDSQKLSPQMLAITPLLNWFSFGFIGFWLLDQHLKAVRVTLICILGFLCLILPWLIISALSALDAFAIMKLKRKGIDYPKNGYCNKLLFKIMKRFDRDAVLIQQ